MAGLNSWSTLFCASLLLNSSFVCLERYKQTDLVRILKVFNAEYEAVTRKRQLLEWDFMTNITEETARARMEFEQDTMSGWMTTWKRWARRVNVTGISGWPARAIEWMSAGIAFHDPELTRELVRLKSIMSAKYASASVYIDEEDRLLVGENEVNDYMGQVQDPAILMKVWQDWHSEAGTSIRDYFIDLVKLYNFAAKSNGYQDLGEAWRAELNMEKPVEEALRLWEEVKDFYQHLHAYVRRRLKEVYGDHVNATGPIPVHLLGNLWGENWLSLKEILQPFPSKTVEAAVHQYTSLELSNQSVLDTVKLVEDFYLDMGLYPMTDSFWKKSVFLKPVDNRKFDCHPTAFDFMDGEDFRISMCFGKNRFERSFHSLVHEMGHIEYYISYHHLPAIFRNGANSAFHEAVGESMALVARNRDCFNSKPKLQDYPETRPITQDDLKIYEEDINFLMNEALSTFVALPWALALELWRYEVFNESVNAGNMNRRWWELREQYQGVKAPVPRSETDFDPGAKYQIANNLPYIRYYFSRFLAHQFQESLCRHSHPSWSGPLYKCCPVGSPKAATKFRLMLSLGSWYPWKETLNKLTGSTDLSGRPLMTYFRPLYDWLKEQNKEVDVTAGWTK